MTTPEAVLKDPELILPVTVSISAVIVEAVTTPLKVPPVIVPGNVRRPIGPAAALNVWDVILPDTVRLATLIPFVTVNALIVAAFVTVRSEIVPVVVLND